MNLSRRTLVEYALQFPDRQPGRCYKWDDDTDAWDLDDIDDIEDDESDVGETDDFLFEPVEARR